MNSPRVDVITLGELLRLCFYTLMPIGEDRRETLSGNSVLVLKIIPNPAHFFIQIFFLRGLFYYIRKSQLFTGKLLIDACPDCSQYNGQYLVHTLSQVVESCEQFSRELVTYPSCMERLATALVASVRSALSLVGGWIIATSCRRRLRRSTSPRTHQPRGSHDFSQDDVELKWRFLIDLDHTLIQCNSAKEVLALMPSTMYSRTRLLVDSLLGLPAESNFLFECSKKFTDMPKLERVDYIDQHLVLLKALLDAVKCDESSISTLSMPFCFGQLFVDETENLFSPPASLFFPLYHSLCNGSGLSGVYKYDRFATILVTDSTLDIRRFFPAFTLLV